MRMFCALNAAEPYGALGWDLPTPKLLNGLIHLKTAPRGGLQWPRFLRRFWIGQLDANGVCAASERRCL